DEADGVDGADEVDAVDGVDGADEVDAVDGVDGADEVDAAGWAARAAQAEVCRKAPRRRTAPCPATCSRWHPRPRQGAGDRGGGHGQAPARARRIIDQEIAGKEPDRRPPSRATLVFSAGATVSGASAEFAA